MRFAVIGAGSGGQCMAAHLALLGHSVSLYDVDPEKAFETPKTKEYHLGKQAGRYRGN